MRADRRVDYSVREAKMRRTIAAIVMLGWSAVAVAQSPVTAPGGFSALPPIGLPLPPIGLPLPPIGLAPVVDTQPRISGGPPSLGPEQPHPRFSSHRSSRSSPAVVYLIPTYGWGYQQPAQAATPAANSPNASSIDRVAAHLTGRLRLDVQADGGLQLYVDGYYVGTSEDLNDELELEAGPHNIEIRAPGYETLAFDVKIAPGRSITYQGALTRADAKPEVTSPLTPATPTSLYFIPGCYLGNVPPQDVALPATCDLSRLIVRKP